MLPAPLLHRGCEIGDGGESGADCIDGEYDTEGDTGEVESVDVESCCWSGEGDFGEWYEKVDEPVRADDAYVRIRWWFVIEREVGLRSFSDSDDVSRT
jgi:hypothetical protein